MYICDENIYIMSLDTVLKIGKVLRNSNNSLKHFKYVQPCPRDKKGNYPLCLSFKVNDDFSIDFNSVSIVPENQRDKLYYLTFKTSDNDGLVKYIYGDIYYAVSCSVKKNGELEPSEGGYYRLPNPNHPKKAYQNSSFVRGLPDFDDIIGNQTSQPTLFSDTAKNINQLFSIRTKIKDSIKIIEDILRYSSAVRYYFDSNIKTPFADFMCDTEGLYNISVEYNYKKASKHNLNLLNIKELPDNDDIIKRQCLYKLSNNQIFIHFDYKGKHWYDFKDCLNAVSKKMFEEFVDEIGNNEFVFKKTLYKNICSGDDSNDIQFPKFLNAYKKNVKSFSEDEVNYLFYGKNYADRGKLISKDIKLIVLPFGDNLEEDDYMDFLEKRNEQTIIESNNEYKCSFFDFVFSENPKITVFDVILTKKGGKSPDSDLVEISGIEKSKLRHTNERISEIAHRIYKERADEIKTEKDLNSLSIEYSFLNILGNPFYDEKTKKLKIVENPKYQSHLLKVLPLIYRDNYVNYNVLLPAFIQNVESSIRSDDNKFAFLKYDLKFLYGIQNSKTDKYMEITETKSYKLGVKLGKMSKPLNKEITSFQKSYVGMLTRRITTKDDCIKFVNDICQKLTMHEKAYNDACAEVCNELANLPSSEYDKEHIAFGFFEGYFKYEPNVSKKNLQKRLEKIMVDYQDSNEFISQIQKISEVIESLKDNKNE